MKPSLRFLDDELKIRIIDEARILLDRLGVEIQNPGVLGLLGDHGVRVNLQEGRAYLDGKVIDGALSQVPRSVGLFDVLGNKTHEIGGETVYFTPGSAAIHFLDGATGEIRQALAGDYVRLAKLVSRLPNLEAQSTSMIPSDVPEEISDSYRLFLSLLYCEKPVVTGAFSVEGFGVMRDLQLAVRGSREELQSKPLAIFSCCPTSPLKWCRNTSQNLLDCALNGIPAELISMPLAGFMAPVTVVGSLVLHTAESLSGVVISQLACPGAPLLYGGSPAPFDFRYETTPMGAPESMMIACGYSEIGQYLGIPTQAYISLSDSKLLDAQAGFETGMGAALAALSGIHQVSGPGMLEFENCISLEKLVLDNEICGVAQRLRRGMQPREDFPALPLFQELLRERHLLISDHTRKHLKAEFFVPGSAVDRASLASWLSKGSRTLVQRAEDQVSKLIETWQPPRLADDVKKDLTSRMRREVSRLGMSELPGT